MLFLAGLFFLGYRVYMERRETLFGLEERQRGLVYGALALAAFAIVATRRLWNAGGLGAMLWLRCSAPRAGRSTASGAHTRRISPARLSAHFCNKAV